MVPTTFVGIDLTDSYAGGQRGPRAVDVAILNVPTGDLSFGQFSWPAQGAGGWGGRLVNAIQPFRREGTVFVVDGPQALSVPQNGTRDVERYLRTPAHAPWQAPVPGSRPFAGYIKSSIEFFNALVAAGFRLAELGGEDVKLANLFEAYPGAAWPCMYRGAGVLHSKSTVAGRQQRTAILQAFGCNFGNVLNPTHDQLDAALCAVLGWRFFHPEKLGNGLAVELVRPPTPPVAPARAVFRDGGGALREGRMLMPLVASLGGPPPKQPPAPPMVPIPQPGPDNGPRPHKCDWVYFAGLARAYRAETYDLAEQEELIVRSVYNRNGLRIPHVSDLTPGQTILLAYGGHRAPYHALCWCVIDAPDAPVQHGQDVFQGIEFAHPVISQRLGAAGYDPDPVLQQFTVIPIREIHDLQEPPLEVPRPIGGNTIWRWNHVYPP